MTIGEIFFDKFISCNETQNADGSYQAQFTFGFPSGAYGDFFIGITMSQYLFEHYKGVIAEAPICYTSSKREVSIEGSEFTLRIDLENSLEARERTATIIENYFNAKKRAAELKSEAASLLDLPKPPRVPAAHGMGNGTG